MKKFLVVGIAAAALCGAPALAADTSMWNWTGFYIGGQAGYGWKSTGFEWAPASFVHGNVNGGVAGGTIGYNWQVGKSVVGLEADWSWADITGKFQGCGATVCVSKVDNFGTARARIGTLPMNNLLLFATAGAAWGREDRANVNWTGVVQPDFHEWKTAFGWTVGGGAEVMLAPNWTAKMEYLYVDLGKQGFSGFSNGVALLNPGHVNFSFNVVRAGLNYKFGTW